jgi:hypothetical protein
LASDVKKKVAKNANTTPVRGRVSPEGVRSGPPLRPLRLKLGESGPDSPKPPAVKIFIKTTNNVDKERVIYITLSLSAFVVTPPDKGGTP